jgi:hypothetical protein
LSSARRRGSALVCIEPARAPLERHAGGSAGRRDLRTTITTNTLRGPRCARLCPVRRNGPYLRTGYTRWMATCTPWRSEERRRAGSRPAQRRRTRAHAAEPVTPPGASTSAERPSWRNRSRDPRRPLPAFLEEIPALSLGDRRRVVFEIADHPADAHPGRRPGRLSDSVNRVPPRARAAITSLSPSLVALG